MPRFDGTGPTGNGPTGMRQGPCGKGINNGNILSSVGNWFRGFGRGNGRGMGFGRGRGFRNFFRGQYNNPNSK